MNERRLISIIRGESGEFGTFGKLTTGTFSCVTLERPPVGDHPCIPIGDYDVDWLVGVHPKHPEVYEIMNVPGRTAILIHAANSFEQLLGCVAPGMEVVPSTEIADHKGIAQSDPALRALIADLKQQPFRLSIR